MFIWIGAIKNGLTFHLSRTAGSIVGGLFILYATVVYPVLGHILGHGSPRSPSFGIGPCPSTILTFGLLLWTDRRVAPYVLIIPLIWSLIGFTAALTLGMKDIALLLVGLVGSMMILLRDKRGKATTSGILFPSEGVGQS